MPMAVSRTREETGHGESGLLSERDYRRFIFELPTWVHIESDPKFFDGTLVGGSVRAQILKGARSG